MMKVQNAIFVLIVINILCWNTAASFLDFGIRDNRLVEKKRGELRDKVDWAINWLEDVRPGIDSFPGLTPAEKDRVRGDVDGYIAFFKQKREELDSASSIRELTVLGNEMQRKWQGVMNYKDSVIGVIEATELQDIVDKAESLSAIIDEKLDELEAQGRDTSTLRQLEKEFVEETTNARQKVDSARETFKSGRNMEGNALLEESRTIIQGMYSLLVEIIREYNRVR